jgi:hypothetical protein
VSTDARIPDRLADEIRDALTEVFGRRINKGLAGDYEALGALVLEDPSAMRFLIDFQNAVCAVLRKWGIETNPAEGVPVLPHEREDE